MAKSTLTFSSKTIKINGKCFPATTIDNVGPDDGFPIHIEYCSFIVQIVHDVLNSISLIVN